MAHLLCIVFSLVIFFFNFKYQTTIFLGFLFATCFLCLCLQLMYMPMLMSICLQYFRNTYRLRESHRTLEGMMWEWVEMTASSSAFSLSLSLLPPLTRKTESNPLKLPTHRPAQYIDPQSRVRPLTRVHVSNTLIQLYHIHWLSGCVQDLKKKSLPTEEQSLTSSFYSRTYIYKSCEKKVEICSLIPSSCLPFVQVFLDHKFRFFFLHFFLCDIYINLCILWYISINRFGLCERKHSRVD